MTDFITFGRPLPVFLIIIIAMAVLLLTFFLYRRAEGVNKGMRLGLGLLRVAALLLIIFVLLEPNKSKTQTISRKQHVAVLIDVSKSMSLVDQRKRPADIADAAKALGLVAHDTTQSDNDITFSLDNKQRAIIETASRLGLSASLIRKSPVFSKLNEDVDINYYTFGNQVNMIGGNDPETVKALGSLKAVESGTSIADSLEAVINSRGEIPLSAITLISDGIDTSSRRTESIVNDLGAKGIPVYTIAVGIPDPDDVSIRSVVMQDVVFTGDTVPIRVQIRSKGYEKREADIVLKFNGEELYRKSILLKGGVQYEDLEFDVLSKDKEAANIEISVDAFADESTADNNISKRSLRVVNEKINVLCIEGSARWEFRYLRAILKRDPRINAKFIATRAKQGLAQLSPDYISRFPEDPAEAFKYDLVILGDVDAAFFTEVEMARLEELIRERGASLLVLCGRRFMPASYVGTNIENILPVKFDPDASWIEVDDSVHPVLTDDGRSSLVMSIEDTKEKNDHVWARVAPLNLLPPLTSAKQGATVLASLSDSDSKSYPLISWQRYGTGKCMVIGTDNLWRVRFKTGDKYHWRIWSQAIQFMTLSRLLGEHKRIRLETDRVSYQNGSQVRVYASVMDESYEPVIQSAYDVFISDMNDSSGTPTQVTLRPNPANPGQYEGYFTAGKTSRYILKPPEEDSDSANSIEFQIAEKNFEMAHPESQLKRLKDIAELSGGKHLGIGQLAELEKLINKDRHTVTVKSSVPIWDHWLLMFLIVTFVGFEWILRRKRDLA